MNERGYAVITGATSGIGEAFATRLADDGYDLLITGRRRAVIDEMAARLRFKYGATVRVVLAELSDARDLERLKAELEKIENIAILINNAGSGSKSGFLESDYSIHARMIASHITAVAGLVHAVAPKMVANGRGAIINVSSLMAFFPYGSSEIYGATKAFINIFSEALHINMRAHNVKIQVLCPGLTRTDFHARLQIDSKKLVNRAIVRWMKADDVARISLRSLKKKKVTIIPGLLNKIVYLLLRLVPKRLYYPLAARVRKSSW